MLSSAFSCGRSWRPFSYFCIRVSSTSRPAGQPPKVQTARRQTVLTLSRKRKSLSGGASPERLWGTSERASARLVFLFLGGFLLGCHEVFPPFERFVFPRFSTGHLDARATQLLV